jgi:hypothetical protein
MAKPRFAGEIIVARRNMIGQVGTKIDDVAEGLRASLPKFSKEEKLKHYILKLRLVWEGRLCLD